MWTWEIRQIWHKTRSHCSFCSLLISAARAAVVALPVSTSTRCILQDPDLGIYNPGVLQISFGHEDMMQAYPQGLNMTISQGFIRGVAREKLDCCQIDLSFMQLWYSACKEQYAQCCWSGACNGDGLAPFRLIDVRLGRVVPAPANCEYIALSYVWVRRAPNTLKTADIRYDTIHDQRFESSYGLLDKNELPRTILDAMFVVASIGENYLWVDSLCIIQDDDDDLRHNLREMHRIYSCANLTVVAAHGDNSDAGIPGLYPESRNIHLLEEVVEGVSIYEKESPMTIEICETTWRKRAWTYQEHSFSDRCLVFANQRAYYEYRSGTRREFMPQDFPQELTMKVSHHPPETTGAALDLLQHHLFYYEDRQLTFEYDILDAFSAVLNEIEEHCDTEFCWGLPINEFLRTLLWTKHNGI
jgi:hypothetical protein